MKAVGVRKAKSALAECIDDSQEDEVLILRHGQPVALLVGVSGLDLEQIAAGVDDELWRTMVRRRAKRERTYTTAQVRRKLGLR